MAPQKYALTYPQLILQAVQKKYDAHSLARLRRASEAALRLMDGFYRAQDTPFICHLTRTASIAMEHGASLDTVLASLLHAVYMFGIFRDGKAGGITRAHQREVQTAVGREADGLIVEYTKLRMNEADLLKAKLEDPAALSAEDREVLLIVLTNELEDFLDLQMVFRRGASCRELIEKKGPLMTGLAKALGHSVLAEELAAAFEGSLHAAVPAAVQCDRRGSYELEEHLRMRRGRLRLFLSGIKQRVLRAGKRKR